MNYELFKPTGNSTARSRIVSTLTEEILSSSHQEIFPLESELRLCRRFNVSRVTIRYALSDLEQRGLIYRKHGKGTFAYGHAARIHRNIAFFFKSSQVINEISIIDLIRGAQAVTAALRCALILISLSPCDWKYNMITSLAGVIIIPGGVTLEEFDTFRIHKIPYISIGDHASVGKGFSFFDLGQQAVNILMQTAITGSSVERHDFGAVSA